MTQTLELALLGNPELRLGGQPLSGFRSAKTQALLTYLAVSRRAQSRITLAGLFWGDVGEYYARRNLNRTLSNLTQLVGDHLSINRQTLALDRSQPYWLDVEVLEAAVAKPLTPEHAATLGEVVNLYRGDFLAGFYVHDAPEFEQWVLTERVRLRECVLKALHALATYHAASGNLPMAIDHTRRVLTLEPWREEAHRHLMIFLAQSGQRSVALTQFEICRQALADELNVEPDAATLDLVARIRAGEFERVKGWAREEVNFTQAHPPIPPSLHPPIPPSLPHHLPLQPTPFVGRAVELTAISRLLAEPDCRLLTLVGLGGMGKTRLALQAAEQVVATAAAQGRFVHGVYFVALEAVRDENGIVSRIIAVLADEIGFPLHAAAPLQEQLLDFLGDKELLFVLDNFEHLLGASGLLSAIIQAAPGVKLLVTSREALALREAWFYPIVGLTLPTAPTGETTADAESDAVRFFVQSAQRIQPGFALSAAVVRICQMVEGMPLAIELATTWLKVLTPEQIVGELARGLEILTARHQVIPERQRSIRVVLEQAWNLLLPNEQVIAARLSVFVGSFDPTAADAVAGASFVLLATLVEKAFVRIGPEGRCHIHELTRQYAAEQLDSTTTGALRDAHAAHYAKLLQRQQPALYTANYQQAFAVVATEFDNVRHAWQWIIDSIRSGRAALPAPALLQQMSEVLATYHQFHTLWLAGQMLFSQAVEVVETAGWGNREGPAAAHRDQLAALVHLRLFTGFFHYEMGHYGSSLAIAEAALVLCRALPLEHDLALALLLYGRTQMRRGAFEAATAALHEVLPLCQRLGATAFQADTLIILGMTASAQGHYRDAQAHLQEALALCQQLGYRPWIARTLTNLGTTYARQHDHRRAQPYYEQALAIAQAEGDQTALMILTSNLGGVQRGFGRYALSIKYYNESLVLARSLSEKRWIAASLNGLAITYLEMGDLTAAEQALREALTVAHRSESTPDTLGSIALLGHVLARRGQVERALRTLTFVEQHPAVMARDRLFNAPLLAELRSELPAAAFDKAAAWAAAHSLDEMVDWLEFGDALAPTPPLVSPGRTWPNV
jgi:predicted ATPase/DNA-binding SARP family transcriptional activator/Tfp pilus assembly protein PilF